MAAVSEPRLRAALLDAADELDLPLTAGQVARLAHAAATRLAADQPQPPPPGPLFREPA